MTYYRDSNKSNMAAATNGAGTAYPFGAHKFTSVFSEVPVARFLVFCVMHCRSLFVLFLWAIMLSSFF